MHRKQPSKRTSQSDQRRYRWSLKVALTGLIVAVVGVSSFGAYPYAFVSAPKLPTPPLKDLAAAHGVELAVLTTPGSLDRKPFVDVLTSQFSEITTDGTLHWDKLRPAPDKYDFAAADKVVDFAVRNHLPVQAHHLIWDESDSLPAWLKDGNYTPQQLRDIMREHIKTVVGHYKGKVTEWSVVNEPFTRAQHIYNLDSWWADHLGGGTGYIDDAFRWAREADPKAKLILNDFRNETASSISDAQYDYVKAAKARGVPIDGVGIQLHVDAARPSDKAAMIRNMQRFMALGTPVYVTEFDVNSTRVKGNAAYRSEVEARVTADAIGACVESKSCASFTVFGMTNVAGFAKFTVYNRARSYLFTSRYQPRQMYYSFRNALSQPQ